MQKVMQRQSIRVEGPAVVLPLREWKDIEEDLAEYREKKKAIEGVKQFGKLAEWGRGFAKKRRITKLQVLEDD